MTEAAPSLRLDKWLWQARFFKSRSIAAEVVSAGKVRVDGTPVSKPARAVRPGVVLTFPQGDRVRVVKIIELGTRRGPAPEAQGLYEDLSPAPAPRDLSSPQAEKGGRPTKRDRRRMGLPLE
ncbi:MAG: RNA-binding protein S4 [Rhodobacterales bacterium]|nr:MAG: RNA-binding protein S4 [Rhodobacterales bacterium]